VQAELQKHQHTFVDVRESYEWKEKVSAHRPDLGPLHSCESLTRAAAW
jgi:hypothetical protein